MGVIFVKSDLICITTLCIFNVPFKGKVSSESILIFVYIYDNKYLIQFFILS